MTSVREAVADAINTAAIPGVTGSEYPPQTKRPGTVWAQWSATAMRQMGNGAVVVEDNAWQVYCLLPELDNQQTADALDTWVPAVCDALAPYFRVVRAIPTSVTVGEGSAVPAFSVTIAAP